MPPLFLHRLFASTTPNTVPVTPPTRCMKLATLSRRATMAYTSCPRYRTAAKDQRQGDAAVLHARQGGQHNQHEHNAAGPQQGGAGEEHALQDAGDPRRQ